MRPAGVELARRWLAALLLAPEDEREAVVESVEARMSEVYASGRGGSAVDEPGGASGLWSVVTPERRELRDLAAAEGSGGSAARKAKKKSAKKRG